MTSTSHIEGRATNYALLALVIFTLGAAAGLSNLSQGEVDLLSAMAMGAGVGAWLGAGFGVLANRDLERAVTTGAAFGMLTLAFLVTLTLIAVKAA